MPKPRPPYSPEYRRQALELLPSGTPLKEVAADLGVSEQTLTNSRRQDDIDAGRVEGLTTEEHQELRPLRRENRRLSTAREPRFAVPVLPGELHLRQPVGRAMRPRLWWVNRVKVTHEGSATEIVRSY